MCSELLEGGFVNIKRENNCLVTVCLTPLPLKKSCIWTPWLVNSEQKNSVFGSWEFNLSSKLKSIQQRQTRMQMHIFRGMHQWLTFLFYHKI